MTNQAERIKQAMRSATEPQPVTALVQKPFPADMRVNGTVLSNPAYGTAPGGNPWSHYNGAIFDQVSDDSADAPHIAVRARAGSGKTTTGVHALGLTPRDANVLALAFNADIAKTLGERVPEHCDARTFHSLGMAACSGGLGRVKVDKDKVRKIATALCPDDPKPYISALVRVVSLAKSTLTPITDVRALDKLAARYAVDGAPELGTPNRQRFAIDASNILTRCSKFNGEIDFDDMCWLPVHHNLPMRRYDFVLADEAQDLNACQHALVKRIVGNGRALLIGDDRQAIYGFRGAHANSFDSLAQHFNAEVLPLSVCYRCDASIVELAKQTVPDFEARPGAPDGIVRDLAVAELIDQVRPGDFVLSRSKAPLLGQCLALIGDGTPAVIVGRDIASGLIGLVRKSKAGSVAQLDTWLRDRVNKAREAYAVSDPDIYEEIADQAACVNVVMREAPSVDAVIEKIAKLFSDAAGSGVVRLSTTHKAKGLEAERVFLLADTYCKRPGIEEENLWYVAVTRAKHELVLCYKDLNADEDDGKDEDE